MFWIFLKVIQDGVIIYMARAARHKLPNMFKAEQSVIVFTLEIVSVPGWVKNTSSMKYNDNKGFLPWF